MTVMGRTASAIDRSAPASLPGRGAPLRRWGTATGLAVATMVAVAGCDDGKVGGPIPVQPLPSAIPGERSTVTGTIAIEDDGCIDLDLGDHGRRWIVWPYDVLVDGAGPLTAVAVQVGGHDLVDGDRISGTGALLDAADLPDWGDAGSDLGSLGRDCAAADRGVVVLDEVRLVADGA